MDQRLRAILIGEQERIGARVGALEAQIDALTGARRNTSEDDEHDPEGVTLSSEWSMLSGLLNSARTNAEQVSAALDRLEAGSYGICVSCQQPIPPEQLEVRPFRAQCVACAS